MRTGDAIVIKQFVTSGRCDGAIMGKFFYVIAFQVRPRETVFKDELNSFFKI